VRVELNPTGWTPEEETVIWMGETQASDRDHLCEPANPELRLVFFNCKHCAQPWLLESGAWRTVGE
jgi:hypothetical protein